MTDIPKDVKEYFEYLTRKVTEAYGIAKKAKEQGYDPEDRVDIPLARNMAERVEGLMSAVAPEIVGKGMTDRIQELEKEHAPLDWRVGFKIAVEVAQEKFVKFKDKLKAMEIGIRVGFAYLTGGIVSAPLEGFIELKLKKRKDGKEYFSVCYAGPIRGAGGTAAAVSVLLSDYVRLKMGYDCYDPTEQEINRLVTEVYDYHERCVNLQYLPSKEELVFLLKHLPVELSGDPTEGLEVSNHKDLERVETNRIRGGVCLVLAEGIAQKAPKLWKRVSKWGAELGLEWGFLEKFLKLQKEIKSMKKSDSSEPEEKLSPNYTFIADLVAGRPVLTYPMRNGGFRLRYGRCRVSGFSAASINPAAMIVLDKFVATGTQLKVERPGKAAAITPCDTIDGPIVKVKDGSVLMLNNVEDARKYSKEVVEILYMGDILFNYGDFSENGHILVPAGYCPEWWVQELEKSAVNMFGTLDMEKLSELTKVPVEILNNLLKYPLTVKPDADVAIKLSKSLNLPLHPDYLFHWKSISVIQLKALLLLIGNCKVHATGENITKIVLGLEPVGKRALELLGVPHLCVNNEFVVIKGRNGMALLFQLGLAQNDLKAQCDEAVKGMDNDETLDVYSFIGQRCPVEMRDKSGTFIGARMGRPEKAKMRKLTGSPHALFPVGEQGGRLRCFQSCLEVGNVKSHFPMYKCKKCSKDTIYRVCESCGRQTQRFYYCSQCGIIETEECKVHSNEEGSYRKTLPYTIQEIDISHYFNQALKKLQMKTHPDLIKGVKGTSNKDHVPENLAKGILRAKHGVFVNKDGTTRFDMSELPITHFKPGEISCEIARLKELGYTKDIHGKDLVSDGQTLELKAQDIILPASSEALEDQADTVLVNISKFVDDLLVNLYGLEPYYNITKREELIGHLVIGLAPHISAGMIGRIIGFSNTQGCFAHPLWHAALRRDCDGDEACVILLMDGLINFSRSFLPDKRGGRTMDSPLVITSILDPSEVDDQAHGLDVVWKYPLELYEAALDLKAPWEVEVEQIAKRLNTEKLYDQIGFTHAVSDINQGVNCSAYKILPSMAEKLEGQMKLAVKIRAVDQDDVARLVIEKHFLKDTKGNLRKFSQQQFRCVKCNTKFRRPPLVGKCTACGGKIIFTISEGSVVKYLEPSIYLAEKYHLSPHLKQTLELHKRMVEDNFGKEKEKQEGLGKWAAV